jgi:hypothetical protein
MPSEVFVSYQRNDAKWQAGEIYRVFKQVLPSDHVFMDIDRPRSALISSNIWKVGLKNATSCWC